MTFLDIDLWVNQESQLWHDIESKLWVPYIDIDGKIIFVGVDRDRNFTADSRQLNFAAEEKR